MEFRASLLVCQASQSLLLCHSERSEESRSPPEILRCAQNDSQNRSLKFDRGLRIFSHCASYNQFLPELVEERAGSEGLRGGYVFVAEVAEIVG